ncbi:MAG: phasin family protein [Gammaproteobacteria bacterium]|nr:phasin family protein [Gammaproteobacteria bacterium]
MAAKKRTKKQRVSENKGAEIAEQLEHAFLAGLGALSNAQKAGEKTFESLVKQGEAFRKKTTKKTEALIDDVQDAIRNMSGDAQSRASGLLDQMRDKTNLRKVQGAFDSRVADAMDRLNVPSKNDIDKINAKLNKILRAVDDKPVKATAAPKARKIVKKAAKKPAKKTAKKKTAKKTSRKTAKKSASKKKAA